MKTIIIITFSIFLTACNFNLNRTNTTKISVNSATIKLGSLKFDEIRQDTIKLNEQKYIQIQSTERKHFNCLISLLGDTVVKSENYYQNAEYIDINEDGYKDIRVFVISNTPNQCDNYLYDKSHKTFRYLENCDLDIKKIAGKNLYYSYNSTGCSDMNWESYLSEIVDYKLIHLGHIEGQGCDYNTKENPQVIEIYKITNPNNDDKTLIEKLPYKKNIPNSDDKWKFIENYWTKNFSRFEKKDSTTLVHIIEPILFGIYGEKKIVSERPYEVHLFGDNWLAMGSLPKDSKGGTFEVVINRKTCEIIHLSHGK